MERRSASALLLTLALPLAQEKPPVTPAGRVEERVTVRRVVLTGRVIDRFAKTISGLAPSDFRLLVDGRETFDFPDLARLRVERSLDGSYELVFRGPAAGRGWHDIEIALTGRVGTALFPRWYRDGPNVSSR